MSTDNDSNPPDRLPSPLTTAEQVTEPVGAGTWDTPPHRQDASPAPGQGTADTPSGPVEAEPAERTGILLEQVDYTVTSTPIADLIPLEVGLAVSALKPIIESWPQRYAIEAEVKDALDKAKDDLLAKGRVVGQATAEALGEMVHQVYGDPPDPTVGRR